jgi:hypothetical protein
MILWLRVALVYLGHLWKYISIFKKGMSIIQEYKYILDFRVANVNYEPEIKKGLKA